MFCSLCGSGLYLCCSKIICAFFFFSYQECVVVFCGLRSLVLSLKSSGRGELQTTFTYYHFRHRSVVVYIDFESMSASAWKKAKGIRHWLSLDTPTALKFIWFECVVFGSFCRYIFGFYFLLLNTLSTILWALEKTMHCQWIVMSSFSFLFHSKFESKQ